MSLLNRILRITLAISLAGSSAFADLAELRDVVFNGNLNGRSTAMFRGNNNIESIVPKNSRGTILETKPLATRGTYALRVRLTHVANSRDRSAAKVDEEVWVHYSSRNPWLRFSDNEGVAVPNPAVNLQAQAQRHGNAIRTETAPRTPSMAPQLTPQERSLQSQRVAAPGIDPNLARNSNPRATEGASACINCVPTAANPQTELQPLPLPPPPAPPVPRARAPRPSPAATTAPAQWADDPAIMAYANSPAVSTMISHARRNAAPRSRSYCYRYVKRSLLAGGLVGSYPPGANARDAVRDLKAQGMVNMLDNPRYRAMIRTASDAPKGAVIVYSNGRHSPGDIQIKTEWGSDLNQSAFVSDFRGRGFLHGPRARQAARAGRPYQIIGVMIQQ